MFGRLIESLRRHHIECKSSFWRNYTASLCFAQTLSICKANRLHILNHVEVTRKSMDLTILSRLNLDLTRLTRLV